MNKYKNQNGFTIVELLVVVSIIAILSIIGVIYYTNLQKRARDSSRKTYIESIAKALEINKTPETYMPLSASQVTVFTSVDPQGNAYCIASGTPPNPSFLVPWEMSCPAGFEIFAEGVPLGNFTSWKACTYLEAPPSGQENVYCKSGSI